MKYPLIEQLGLAVHRNGVHHSTVWASDLERLLEAAPVVASFGKMIHWNDTAKAAFMPEAHTHTALLVSIQPTKPDSAESLLREFVRLSEAIGEIHVGSPIVERVRNWLKNSDS